MRQARFILDLYLNSSLHVALSVTALGGVTLLHFGQFPELKVLLFLFFSTVTGYNFVKYAGVANLHHLERTKNVVFIRRFSVLTGLATLYFLMQLDEAQILFAGAVGALTLLYAVPIFGGRNLRSIRGIKIYIIALVWAGSTAGIPLIAQPGIDLYLLLTEGVSRFLFVTALILPFEIRDLKYDPVELGTLPKVMGVKGTKVLGASFLLLMVLMQWNLPTSEGRSLVLVCLIALLTAVSIWLAKPDQGEYYASLWVESIPIIWFLAEWYY